MVIIIYQKAAVSQIKESYVLFYVMQSLGTSLLQILVLTNIHEKLMFPDLFILLMPVTVIYLCSRLWTLKLNKFIWNKFQILEHTYIDTNQNMFNTRILEKQLPNPEYPALINLMF